MNGKWVNFPILDFYHYFPTLFRVFSLFPHIYIYIVLYCHHTQRYSRVVSGFVFRNYSWQCSWDYVGCRRLNPDRHLTCYTIYSDIFSLYKHTPNTKKKTQCLYKKQRPIQKRHNALYKKTHHPIQKNTTSYTKKKKCAHTRAKYLLYSELHKIALALCYDRCWKLG